VNDQTPKFEEQMSGVTYGSGEPHGILCGKGHRHATVEAVRACYGSDANAARSWDSPSGMPRAVPVPPDMALAGATRPSVASGDTRRVIHTSAAPTDAQRDTVKRLGGTIPEDATRLRASQIIDRLIEMKETRDRRLKEQADEEDAAPKFHSTSLGLPAEMLFSIREGRYAVSVEGTKRLDFVRISHIKARPGKQVRFAGCMRVQTQHGEQLKERAIISPKGEVRLMSQTMPAEYLTKIFMLIIVDQRSTAILYGREKGQCCRCGKQLTDERSRHYGIGPECEKHLPEIIDELDEAEGVYVPGQMLEEA